MSDQHGQWIRKPKASIAVIFVHGFLSSGDTCWRSSDIYWPDLIGAEESITDVGIYVFSYRADALAAGYSLGDAVEALNAYLELDKLLDLQSLIFVCHSMGGIVVRQLLVTRQSLLIDKSIHIGLFLVASPSLGSTYANMLSALAKALGNSEAEALRFADNNAWLNDLDRNFTNLKESGRLFIRGQEIVEDEFIVLHAFLRRQVVQAFSGARYFGESVKIPHSNHFTIAKPSNRDALQHRLLVQFIERSLLSAFAETNEAQPPTLAASSVQERLDRIRTQAGRLDKKLTGPVKAAGHYYFYISKDKVSRMEEALDGAITDVPVGIGSTTRMSTEFRTRSQMASQVLARLIKTENILDLSTTQPTKDFRGWATGELELMYSRQEENIIFLDGFIAGNKLTLACSEDGFLDYDPVREKMVVNSTNHYFYNGGHAYRFKSHFLIVSFDNELRCILGSPLYLAISSGILA
jgi:pimeloyl-ACP methyl ester carboxylesterase